MLKILHVYPDLLSLYGEYANVKALAQRLAAAGETVEVVSRSTGERLPLADTDLVYIGAGTEAKLLAAADDLQRHKDKLLAYLEKGGLVLATGNAVALFGNTITAADGTVTQGLGAVDADAVLDGKRRYAEVVAGCDLTAEKVVGAINTSMKLTVRETPLFKVELASEAFVGAAEGYVKGGLFATELCGPLLVRNPALLDVFAAKVAKKDLPPCEEGWYRFARAGYSRVLETLGKEAGMKTR